MLTGSSDTRLRCWRLAPGDVANSYAIGGRPAEDPITAYRETQATWLPAGCRGIQEVYAPREPAVASASKGAPAANAVGADDRGCAAAVTCAAFCQTPQPGLLAAGSLDGTVRLWR